MAILYLGAAPKDTNSIPKIRRCLFHTKTLFVDTPEIEKGNNTVQASEANNTLSRKEPGPRPTNYPQTNYKQHIQKEMQKHDNSNNGNYHATGTATRRTTSAAEHLHLPCRAVPPFPKLLPRPEKTKKIHLKLQQDTSQATPVDGRNPAPPAIS